MRKRELKKAIRELIYVLTWSHSTTDPLERRARRLIAFRVAEEIEKRSL